MKWKLKRWAIGLLMVKKGETTRRIVVADYTIQGAVDRIRKATAPITLYHFRRWSQPVTNQIEIMAARQPGVWRSTTVQNYTHMKELKA